VSRKCTRALLTFFAFGALLCHSAAAIHQEPNGHLTADSGRSSLVEVRGKKRALLLVLRAGVVDTEDNERPIIELALKSEPDDRRYRLVYGTLGKRLNVYIRKYRSMTPASQVRDADYIILFNLLEYRTILNTTYPYGELFVVVKGSPDEQTPARIVWKSKKVQWAGDAVNDLIKQLRIVRGEM
jgi:hypothetical protein